MQVYGRPASVVLLDDRRLEVVIQPTLFSGQLLDLIASHCNIREREYFGLAVADDSGHYTWLQLDRKVLDHDLPHTPVQLTIHFLVKFFIESISHLMDDQTIEMFFLQAKSLMFRGTLEVDSDIVFQLAALALQAMHGDYIDESVTRNMVRKSPILPAHVLKQHPEQSLTLCEDFIIRDYQKLRGQTRGQAVVNYMTIVESMPTYGVHYFEVHDKNQVPWWIGLSCRGIAQYRYTDRKKPLHVFPWNQLENLYFRDKKFSIEVHDRDFASAAASAVVDTTVDAPVNRIKVFVWFGKTQGLTKCIWQSAISQHQFYLDRKQARLRQTHPPRTLKDIARCLTHSTHSLSSSDSMSNVSNSIDSIHNCSGGSGQFSNVLSGQRHSMLASSGVGYRSTHNSHHHSHRHGNSHVGRRLPSIDITDNASSSSSATIPVLTRTTSATAVLPSPTQVVSLSAAAAKQQGQGHHRPVGTSVSGIRPVTGHDHNGGPPPVRRPSLSRLRPVAVAAASTVATSQDSGLASSSAATSSSCSSGGSGLTETSKGSNTQQETTHQRLSSTSSSVSLPSASQSATTTANDCHSDNRHVTSAVGAMLPLTRSATLGARRDSASAISDSVSVTSAVSGSVTMAAVDSIKSSRSFSLSVATSVETKEARKEIMDALKTRRDALTSQIDGKMGQIRDLCVREAELTGELPDDTPRPKAGEPAIQFRRRIGTGFKLSQAVFKQPQSPEETLLNSLQTEFEIQSKIVAAAERLVNDTSVSKSVKRQRKASYLSSAQKLRELESKLNALKYFGTSKHHQQKQQQQLLLHEQHNHIERHQHSQHGLATSPSRLSDMTSVTGGRSDRSASSCTHKHHHGHSHHHHYPRHDAGRLVDKVMVLQQHQQRSNGFTSPRLHSSRSVIMRGKSEPHLMSALAQTPTPTSTATDVTLATAAASMTLTDHHHHQYSSVGGSASPSRSSRLRASTGYSGDFSLLRSKDDLDGTVLGGGDSVNDSNSPSSRHLSRNHNLNLPSSSDHLRAHHQQQRSPVISLVEAVGTLRKGHRMTQSSSSCASSPSLSHHHADRMASVRTGDVGARPVMVGSKGAGTPSFRSVSVVPSKFEQVLAGDKCDVPFSSADGLYNCPHQRTSRVFDTAATADKGTGHTSSEAVANGVANSSSSHDVHRRQVSMSAHGDQQRQKRTAANLPSSASSRCQPLVVPVNAYPSLERASTRRGVTTTADMPDSRVALQAPQSATTPVLGIRPLPAFTQQPNKHHPPAPAGLPNFAQQTTAAISNKQLLPGQVYPEHSCGASPASPSSPPPPPLLPKQFAHSGLTATAINGRCVGVSGPGTVDGASTIRASINSNSGVSNDSGNGKDLSPAVDRKSKPSSSSALRSIGQPPPLPPAPSARMRQRLTFSSTATAMTTHEVGGGSATMTATTTNTSSTAPPVANIAAAAPLTMRESSKPLELTDCYKYGTKLRGCPATTTGVLSNGDVIASSPPPLLPLRPTTNKLQPTTQAADSSVKKANGGVAAASTNVKSLVDRIEASSSSSTSIVDGNNNNADNEGDRQHKVEGSLTTTSTSTASVGGPAKVASCSLEKASQQQQNSKPATLV